ncbi:LLM class flavin-dependent oxidoreductase [Streptomyces avicenniae]|uniref:LLM class flavin-dependent oxidoreductase n=1 Tax=Streptomyces avicenniae TaxID=500153 RepID=UPI00069B6227|nr:LLM class flavin-dependent oxidoreductase [Streptomyces avicenniae]
MTGVRRGVVILPEHRWEAARHIWRLAEELGFDHAWTYDHVVWRWLREKPWYGAIPTLTAAAAATSSIRLGTLVASPGLRGPVTFAKEITTLDDISGGRALCGLGAGGYGADLLRARPLSPAERAERFTEFVEVTTTLLRGGTVNDLTLVPASAVPVAVAAAGPRGMRLAALHADTWVTSGKPNGFDPAPYPETIPVLREQVRALERACDEVGRDPRSLGRLLLTGASVGGVLDSAEAFLDAEGMFTELGFTDVVVHWPRPEFPFQGTVKTLEEISGRACADAT